MPAKTRCSCIVFTDQTAEDRFLDGDFADDFVDLAFDAETAFAVDDFVLDDLGLDGFGFAFNAGTRVFATTG